VTQAVAGTVLSPSPQNSPCTDRLGRIFRFPTKATHSGPCLLGPNPQKAHCPAQPCHLEVQLYGITPHPFSVKKVSCGTGSLPCPDLVQTSPTHPRAGVHLPPLFGGLLIARFESFCDRTCDGKLVPFLLPPAASSGYQPVSTPRSTAH